MSGLFVFDSFCKFEKQFFPRMSRTGCIHRKVETPPKPPNIPQEGGVVVRLSLYLRFGGLWVPEGATR